MLIATIKSQLTSSKLPALIFPQTSVASYTTEKYEQKIKPKNIIHKKCVTSKRKEQTRNGGSYFILKLFDFDGKKADLAILRAKYPHINCMQIQFEVKRK